MKTSIFTTDLHLTEQPRDSYRFGIFPLLCKLTQEHEASYCFIQGDMMDKTDRHSASLVNRVVDEVHNLSQFCKVFILKGNHDYVDPATPYFKFMRYMPNVYYITEPTKVALDGTKVFLLPHAREPMKEWAPLRLPDADLLLIHQTVKGAMAESGTEMEGLPMAFFAGCKEILSGDIHVPQSIGALTYVGSPYHVHFGDKFKPRILIRREDGKRENYLTQFPMKHVMDITNLSDLDWGDLTKGDQSKVFVHLQPSQWKDWANIKTEVLKTLAARGIEVFGLEMVSEGAAAKKSASAAFLLGQQSPHLVLDRFMEQKYPAMADVFLKFGHDIVKEVDGI